MRTGKIAGEYLFLRVNEKRMARKGLMGWRDYDKLLDRALEWFISFKEKRQREGCWNWHGHTVAAELR
ncbi:hypothetical protein [Peribacillus muralis]|uniref:hypothetical protein n=1 Tax=Peribacillus muralis TaxID=264697 RepID=UPI0007108E86|nr:hypothetical protein [Peribacillus muralis]